MDEKKMELINKKYRLKAFGVAREIVVGREISVEVDGQTVSALRFRRFSAGGRANVWFAFTRAHSGSRTTKWRGALNTETCPVMRVADMDSRCLPGSGRRGGGGTLVPGCAGG